ESGPRRAGEKKKNQLAEIAMGTGRLKKDSRPHPQQLDTVWKWQIFCKTTRNVVKYGKIVIWLLSDKATRLA
ncbi:MAG: hypothetical protein LBG71_00065, partial [Clostridiales Family XIII bacterium]|nr:hypothetical protein [Clostridiales Family XIII bacterium]